MINIERQLIYPVALLLSTSPRKTCEAMAVVVNVSGDKLCRILKEKTVTMADLINLSQKVLVGKKWYLIIDDTIIDKIYSKIIEGACDNFDSRELNDLELKGRRCARTKAALGREWRFGLPQLKGHQKLVELPLFIKSAIIKQALASISKFMVLDGGSKNFSERPSNIWD